VVIRVHPWLNTVLGLQGSKRDMDILKARKKAAERKQSRKKPKPEPPPVVPSAHEELPRAAEAEPSSLVLSPDAPATPAQEIEAPSDAAPPEDEAEGTQAQEIDLLSFRLGAEAYALPVNDVREVLKIRTLTPVPNAPPYILGVTALRGTVLPVIDLCVRFGLTPGARDEKSRIIVVNSEQEDVGLVVDRVTGVLRTMSDAIKSTPENVEQGAAFLRGIVRKDEQLYILLDLEKAVGA
jgi:purine-binding chemotaxis protein CheW